MNEKGYSDQAASRGEPSYVWRDGQVRRLAMIQKWAAGREREFVLENGCGVGSYLKRLADDAEFSVGLEVEFERGAEALNRLAGAKGAVVNAVGERLPFADDRFDLITSHEVLEHVQDDRACMLEIVRTLKPGGRLILFVPNRWYPFETHGIHWKNRYFFGNKLFVNYLPRKLRDQLAPHVNVYTTNDLKRLISGLPVRVIYHTVIFGAYDNIISRHPRFGKGLRSMLQWLEKTPLKTFGLSQFWVIEKTEPQS